MSREELIHAMVSAFRDEIIGSASELRQDFKGMAAALDVAGRELLKPYDGTDRTYNSTRTEWHDLMKVYDRLLECRRSRYLKPNLLPCPFCGGEASPNGVIRRSSSPDCRWSDSSECLEAFYCNCVRCGVKNGGIAGGYQTKDQAIAHWNKRGSA